MSAYNMCTYIMYAYSMFTDLTLFATDGMRTYYR